MRQINRKLLAQQDGYTLIELMIAMLLGLFIITTVTRVFLSANESSNLHRQLGLMQQAARIAMTEMASDLRMAGNTGCGSSNPVSTIIHTTTDRMKWVGSRNKVQAMFGIKSFIYLDAQSLLSESLIIFKLHPDVVWQITNYNQTSDIISLDTNVDGILAPGDLVSLIRQDCSQVALIVASTVSGTHISHIESTASSDFGNCRTELKGSFNCSSSHTGDLTFNPGFVRPVDSTAYFIGLEDGLPTLFRKDVSLANTPLVDGIENMRFYFGMDTDGNGAPDRYYRTADMYYLPQKWKQITSVRIHLLVRSEHEVTPTPRDYFFDGSTVTPTDNFLRKEYVMTIALRN